MDRLWAPWRLEYIQRPENGHCIFCLDDQCSDDAARLVVKRGASSYVMMNRYPYCNGHLLIAPFRHLAEANELDEQEVVDMHRLMVQCQQVLMKACSAQGFNVGWNFGRVAGAGIIAHIHMHVVPRWAGDSNFMPILSDTRVIPQHIEKTYQLLLRAFSEEDSFHCNQ